MELARSLRNVLPDKGFEQIKLECSDSKKSKHSMTITLFVCSEGESESVNWQYKNPLSGW